MSHSGRDRETPFVTIGVVYKICSAGEWRKAVSAGRYRGSEHDGRDGFIHFSTAVQLAGTAAKHFRGQADLVLVAVATAPLGTTLRWEASRGGDLFPHLYADLDVSAALWVKPLALDEGGVPILPGDLA